MKRTVLGILLIAPALLAAQQSGVSLLWRISGNGVADAGFVYGTIHGRSERAYAFAAAVESTMDSVNTVAGELDLDAGRRQSAALMSAMMLPDGKRLNDLYSKKDWRVVEAGLTEKLGPMATFVMAMKPFMVLAMLTEAEMGQDRSLLLDDHLLREAKARDRRVIGLETLPEQLRALDVLSLKEQANMLLEHFTSEDHADELERMMSAYVEQDLDALLAMTQVSTTMPRKLEETLITDRNKVMAHRMDSVLLADGSALFLVGAAHLPGENGVLRLLQDRGYTLRPVHLVPQGGQAAAILPPHPPAKYMDHGIRFRNDTLGFEVDMPIEPSKLELGDNVDGAFLTNWLGEDREGNSFMVFTCKLTPEQAKAPNDQLMMALAAGGQRMQGELIEMTEMPGADPITMRSLVYLGKHDRYMRIQLVRPADDLVYLVIVTPMSGTDAPQGDAFLRSFTLLDQ